MTDEEVKQLEAQIHQLSQQLQQQQLQLNQLQQQLQGHKPEPALQPLPASESFYGTIRHSSLENLIGLRLIHLVGIVVLVIGLSLGVKYAIDKNLVSEGLRIILAYAAGVSLFVLSLRLKKNYVAFSAILFSGAMASIYFTTFGAFVYYNFLSYTVAFVVMIVLTFFTAYQALVYNRQEIALLGLVGAYGIPFLISPNTGHAQNLFIYISIINCAVVFLCAKKPWAVVGRAAQIISWLLFIGWAVWQNDAGLKSYGIVFMLLFFISFALNAVSPKLFRRQTLMPTASFQLLANNMAFYMAALFVFGYTFNSTIAIVSLLFAALAAVQAGLFAAWKEKHSSLLLTGLALGFFTVFVGFQWKGITVTLLWLLTAVLVFFAGVRMKSSFGRLAAIVLIGVTLLKLVLLDSLTFTTLQKVIAYLLLGVLLLVVSFFYQRSSASSKLEKPL